MWAALRDRLVAFVENQNMFLAAYPGLSGIGDITFAHAANAIAAFEVRAFGLTGSPFQRFVAGDEQALSAQQVRGALEFYGPGGCARCHSGPTFSDGLFHNIGLPQFGPGKGDGVSGLDDFGRERVTGNAAGRYRFRTPQLFGVAQTAPYGRLGQYATLTEMVRQYVDAPQQLQNYSMLANVSDLDLTGTLLANRAEIASRISGLVQAPRTFDVDAVVTFLAALTPDGLPDLHREIPDAVPSGLPVR